MLKRKEISTVKTWRLWISYLGTYFSGFQIQPGCNSVELLIKKAFKAFIGFSPALTIAGRTDSGVHALGQVVSCSFENNLNAFKLQQGLNHFLKPNIIIWRVDEMPFSFDARKQSVGKSYVYSINQSIGSEFPFDHLRTWYIVKKNRLNINLMKKASLFLIGEHDFESFRSRNCVAKHAIRYIWKIDFTESSAGSIAIDIRGNAFCHNMVRIIVGTLVDVGLGKTGPIFLKNILLGRNRSLAGETAPSSGLTLKEVYYLDTLHRADIPDNSLFLKHQINKGYLLC